jgi:chemotaxis response regulator CheB
MRVGIADSRSRVQDAVRRVIGAAPGYSVEWSARSAAETLDLVEQSPVEVVLLGLTLGKADVTDVTRRLVVERSCPVVLLTEGEGDRVSKVYEAMGAGAIDVATIPKDAFDGDGVLAKLRTVARLLGRRVAPEARARSGTTSQRASVAPLPKLVAIGASTGGPQALLTVLSGLPRDFPGAILIVQHVDRQFSEGLAEWLQDGSGMPVKVAQSGSHPKPGTALLAGTADHLILTSARTLRYTAEPRNLAYRPSVDVLFASLLKYWPEPAVAVLLTGMGKDGAAGLRDLRRAGWRTIAQDEATCVVYGMPKAAAEYGAAARILPISAIAAEIRSAVSSPIRAKRA